MGIEEDITTNMTYDISRYISRKRKFA